MNISWKEIAGISGIVAVISLLERWLVRYWDFSKQRKKLRIYNSFEGSQNHASPAKILKQLKDKAREHDLEDEKIFDESVANRVVYWFKKKRKRLAGTISTKRYSLTTVSQLEPLLYELVQDGMLKTDGESYWRP